MHGRNRVQLHSLRAGRIGALALIVLAGIGCSSGERDHDEGVVDEASQEVKKINGKNVFRYDTFGDERLWTDILRMHEVVSSSVSPLTALAVGFKVDADALPPGILETADLNHPKTTAALIAMNAVVGVQGKLDDDGNLKELGITCALCHSTVDDSVMPGIGHRLDGWPNVDFDPGLVISLSPALSDETRAVYASWGPGNYDPRFNIDGINDPVRIPPAYGLQGVALETYTGDGPISYWNAYVAITQMGGKGNFDDPRIGVSVHFKKDLVTPKLPALLAYQLSLPAPEPPPDSFDEAAATRGRAVFEGAGRCASCHAGPAYTDAPNLHEPSETGMDPGYAERSATGLYRATPLRALWQHAPYFHDGSAETLADVVEHYQTNLVLGLTDAEKSDLVEYLKSL